MAYVTTNPPRIKVVGVSGAPNWWEYSSADAKATVDNSGYFTNGYALGMRDGDLVFVYDTGNKIWSCHTVINTSGTTIDLADGTNIGSSTNTD
jgi:hypothetical protein